MSKKGTETTELIIEGANCPFCLNATLEALNAQPGVTEAYLSAINHCIHIEHEGSDSKPYVELVRASLHGITKYGNEVVMVQVDPELADLHCTHH